MPESSKPRVLEIYVSAEKGKPMRKIERALALKGKGIRGDRYGESIGSYSHKDGAPGNRQITLINACMFKGTEFTPADTRRNVVVEGMELMTLINKEFVIGGARFRGVKYCTVCTRPSDLSKKPGFREAFEDRGGLVAEVLNDGLFSVGDAVLVAI